MTPPKKQIEDAYPLAPIQEGLLFHALRSPEEGVFIAQYTCLLRHVDVKAFEAAWQAAVDRHPVLRTAFVWKSVERAVQVVGSRVGLPLEHLDWRDVPAGEVDERLDELLREDRRRGFDPSRAPLTRLTLARVEEDAWRLVWSFHHLVLDGWCRMVLLGEVFELYRAALAGREPVLQPALPYRRYISWLQGRDPSETARFWRAMLAGFTTPTPLPATWGASPDEPGYDSLETALDEETSVALAELARRNRLTQSTLVQGAWAMVLARHAGVTDVVYGVVVSGRPPELEGSERMMGVFINTLPVRVRVAPEARLIDWLRELQGRLAEMRQYEHSPLVEVQKQSDVAAGTPLFESILAFENYPSMAGSDDDGPGAELEVTDTRSIVRNAYPLAWAVVPGPPLSLRLLHDRDRVGSAAARRVLAELRALLESMARHPDGRLGDLSPLAADDLARVQGEWGRGADHPVEVDAVHRAFAAAAAADAAAPAMVAEDATWNRGELDRWSDRLAYRLRELGVGPETRVGVLLPRGAWTVAAILAAWKAGGAYVPLDDEVPRERLETMLRESGAEVLVTRQETLEAVFGEAPPALPTIDLADPEALPTGPSRPLPRDTEPGQLAYVIFTSGSSGGPKGVAVEHRQVRHYVDAVRRRLDPPKAATYAIVTSFAADLGNTGLLLALSDGGTLVIAGAETARSPKALGDFLAPHAPDVLKMVPSHLAALTEGGQGAALFPAARLVLGGEATPPERLKPWRLLAPTAEVFNHYGPTETTIGVVAGRLDPEDGEVVPLGTPLARTRCHVLDALGQPLGAGTPGELWIGGAGVARGYLGRPGATAERFVPDPFAGSPGARMYRTGDRVAWRDDGRLAFAGRTDLQVKVRGYRVEPREVEEALDRHPVVHRSAVAARADEDGGPLSLHAYYVPLDPALAREGALAEALYELPDGQSVFQLNPNETRHLYEQIHTLGIYARHGIVLEPGARVLDVGANIGMFTLWVHRRSPGARVFAFEPSPTAHARLVLNAALYGLDVTAFPCGVSDADGSATLTVYPRASVMSGFYADAAEETSVFQAYMSAHDGVSELAEHAGELAEGRFEAETVEVPLRSLSSVIREQGIDRIDLLKIDAEKAEMDVLRGLDDEHWPLVRQVVAEVHDIGDRLEETTALLRRHGFEVHLEQDSTLTGSGIHHLAARRPGAPEGVEGETRALPVADEALAEGDLGGSLRKLAAARLPDHMVPRTFTALAELPTLPSGKVDRAGLPDPAKPGAGAGERIAPRTELEKTLAKIWMEVLKLDEVGVEDDFFRLGGDSILNIQIVARALRAGLKMTPAHLFRHPTIAGLAGALEGTGGSAPAAAPPRGEDSEAGGEVPLTPVQRWFFEHAGDAPHHFNMALVLSTGQPIDATALDRALSAVIGHHGALRLRFRPASGERKPSAPAWRQEYGEDRSTGRVGVIDLSALMAERRPSAMDEAGTRVQAGFDLARGPLLRAVDFRLGEGPRNGDCGGRLLLVAHHLVVDGVSWRILLEDLETAYRAALGGAGAIELPPASDSFRRWGEALAALAASPAMEASRQYWSSLAADPPGGLPVDAPGGDNRVASADVVSVTLARDATDTLLEEVPRAYGTQVHEALLTALTVVLGEPRSEGRADGRGRRLAVEMEGHGRETVVEGVDVSRTVGWFTSHYPLVLRIDDARDLLESLRQVKEQVRSAPMNGLGFGLLRYLAPDREAGHAPALKPELRFNYLGQLDRVLGADSAFTLTPEAIGVPIDPSQQRTHVLDLSASVSRDGLDVRWRYSRGLHEEATVRRLADEMLAVLRDLIRACAASETVGYTPSDFPEAGLSQKGLESLVAQLDEGGGS